MVFTLNKGSLCTPWTRDHCVHHEHGVNVYNVHHEQGQGWEFAYRFFERIARFCEQRAKVRIAHFFQWITLLLFFKEWREQIAPGCSLKWVILSERANFQPWAFKGTLPPDVWPPASFVWPLVYLVCINTYYYVYIHSIPFWMPKFYPEIAQCYIMTL